MQESSSNQTSSADSHAVMTLAITPPLLQGSRSSKKFSKQGKNLKVESRFSATPRVQIAVSQLSLFLSSSKDWVLAYCHTAYILPGSCKGKV
jgi:hypothetical protein